jgi:hypothetical protein
MKLKIFFICLFIVLLSSAGLADDYTQHHGGNVTIDAVDALFGTTTGATACVLTNNGTCTTAGAGDITAVGDCTTGACFVSGGTGTIQRYQNATSGYVDITTGTGALGNRTLTLPKESGTFCSTGSVCPCHPNSDGYQVMGQAAAEALPWDADTTPSANGTTLTLVFSEAVVNYTGFSISPSNTLTYSSGSGTNTLAFTLTNTVYRYATDTISYSAGDVVDTATTPNALATISSGAITNNSTQNTPTGTNITTTRMFPR